MITSLAVLRNEFVRHASRMLLPVVSWCFSVRMSLRISRYHKQQLHLIRVYGINDKTQIHGHDEFTRKSIVKRAHELSNVRFATTSGTTGEPKKIIFTPKRLREFRMEAISCTVQMFHQYRVRAPSLFVLASHKIDDSFSSLVLHNSGKPSYLVGLSEPAKHLNHPGMLRRIEQYGATAVRFWLVVISDPGVLYATNPSTISVFLGDIFERWTLTTAMIRDYHYEPDRFNDILPILYQVASHGYARRIQAIARAGQPIKINKYWPSLSAWCSWDGGYVRQYISHVESYLPPSEYPHIPMFSMSTESLETLSYYRKHGQISFLPVGKDIVYEFLPVGSRDETKHLLSPAKLRVGQEYTMVVSDCYGLLRYQTEDVFVCCGFVRNIPDLRFVRRRGIAYSFTGEKLTGEQLTKVFNIMFSNNAWLKNTNAQMSCFPCRNEGGEPYYQLVIVLTHGVIKPAIPKHEIIKDFESTLSAVNNEYKKKRTSGRLGQPRLCFIDYNTLASHADRRTQSKADAVQHAWESQYKLAPLSMIEWDDISTSLYQMENQDSNIVKSM